MEVCLFVILYSNRSKLPLGIGVGIRVVIIIGSKKSGLRFKVKKRGKGVYVSY